MTASASDVLLRPRPTRITLAGQVSGAPSGTEVVLEATAPEYGKNFHPVRKQVDAAGAVSFVVRPKTNTDYRLTIAPGQSVSGASAPVSVRVHPRQHLSFYSNTGRTVRALFEVGTADILAFTDGPMRPLEGPARRAWYYLLPRRSNRLRRIAHARFEEPGCGVFCNRYAWATLRITRALRRARGVAACAEGLAWVGAGVADPACGRKTVRWR